MLLLSILLPTFFYMTNGFQRSCNLNIYSVEHLQMSDNDDPSPIVPNNVNNIPPRYNKKVPCKAKWFPLMNLKAPEMLDGTLAGDVGFDPLNFSSSKKTLYWMREAEVKHGRLAMLAAVGWPLSELWHKNLAEFFHVDSILAFGDKAPSILNGGLSNTYASGILMFSIVIAGVLEGNAMNSGNVFWNSEKPEGYIPGDLGFDPLGLYNKRGNDKKSMQTAEIKNGRLAMMAITSYVIQELVTQSPVVQQTPYLF